jgi:hypothetical protein
LPETKPDGDAALGPLQAELSRLLDGRRATTAAHPFYAWLRDDAHVRPLQKLQRFVPMWAVDVMGYRDLNRYCLRFEEPRDERERAYNTWVDELQTHSGLFLNDWDALDMDDALGWGASHTFEILFLDRNTPRAWWRPCSTPSTSNSRSPWRSPGPIGSRFPTRPSPVPRGRRSRPPRRARPDLFTGATNTSERRP